MVHDHRDRTYEAVVMMSGLNFSITEMMVYGDQLFYVKVLDLGLRLWQINI